MLNHGAVTPSEIAREFGFKPIEVRNWLRAQGWRSPAEFRMRWYLFGEHIDFTRAEFSRRRSLASDSLHPGSTPATRNSASPPTASRTGRIRKTSTSRLQRDADYILDLCDEVLAFPSSREHTFEWLLGDESPRTGKSRKLPVDAYWQSLGLVVEVMETQHYKSTPFFDKPDTVTVSGVHRGVQRRIYDARRSELVPTHGLRLVHIKTSDFKLIGKKIVRLRAADIEIVRRALS
jgi:hypothetical protein